MTLTVNKLLLIVAIVLAFIAMVLGFGWLVDPGDDPHVLGWLSASFVAYFAACLA